MSLIADNGHQRLRTGSGDVADRMKSSPPQGLLRHLADAPQAAHRQGRQDVPFLAVRNPHQPVRLFQVRRQLGQKFIRPDAGRSDEARRPPDILLDRLGNVDDIWIFQSHARHIQKGFVQRQGLYERRVMGQDEPNLMRNTPIMGHAHRQEHAVRAKPAGQLHAHGRMHAELPRLIRRRRDDAASRQSADDDRHPPQGRIVPLLDRRIKRVHIDVHDPTYRRHRLLLFVFSL